MYCAYFRQDFPQIHYVHLGISHCMPVPSKHYLIDWYVSIHAKFWSMSFLPHKSFEYHKMADVSNYTRRVPIYPCVKHICRISIWCFTWEIFHAIWWLLISTDYGLMEYDTNLQTLAKQNWFGTFQREYHSKTQVLFLFKKVLKYL